MSQEMVKDNIYLHSLFMHEPRTLSLHVYTPRMFISNKHSSKKCELYIMCMTTKYFMLQSIN